MFTQDDELLTSRRMERPQRPRDAATLIIVRRDGPKPRVLLGRRHGGHAFMPNLYVFPGGRLDPDDSRMRPVADLPEVDLRRLQLRMRGRASPARARALALAAVRETFEEVGLIIGARQPGKVAAHPAGWAQFVATGHVPDLSGISYFARAITPPGRTRRFDTRFFVADARAIANLDAPAATAEELLTPNWFSFAEALALDLPSITRDVLTRLERAIDDPPGRAPVPFQYMSGKAWRVDLLE